MFNSVENKISDHNPIIHNGVLFWNIMMQAKKRRDGSYNNGFAMEENEKQYIHRLKKIASVLANIVATYPNLLAITLCEGPNQKKHVDIFRASIQKFDLMRRFFNEEQFYTPQQQNFVHHVENWGLFMLADEHYQVEPVFCELMNYPELNQRFQLWKLTKNNDERYLALGHFPFRGNDHFATERRELSLQGKKYADSINQLLAKYENKYLIFCADFNHNPYLIGQWEERALDKVEHNNSLVLLQSTVKSVTVDGILLSKQQKQLCKSLLNGFGFFRIAKKLIQENILVSSCSDILGRNNRMALC